MDLILWLQHVHNI
uniref:Uncharacterized protein n=1 Tax=Lepeophtheirus salmonis TaxID=72036 RepID=A0A0K2V2E2_LEPSM